MTLDIARGGWCPKHRQAEDGMIDTRYPLTETDSPDPAVRTRLNVRDADATLIVASEPLTGGTLLTKQIAVELDRPHLVVDPASPDAVSVVVQWLNREEIGILNVAGPRENQSPGIGERTRDLLESVLIEVSGRPDP